MNLQLNTQVKINANSITIKVSGCEKIIGKAAFSASSIIRAPALF